MHISLFCIFTNDVGGYDDNDVFDEVIRSWLLLDSRIGLICIVLNRCYIAFSITQDFSSEPIEIEMEMIEPRSFSDVAFIVYIPHLSDYTNGFNGRILQVNVIISFSGCVVSV